MFSAWGQLRSISLLPGAELAAAPIKKRCHGAAHSSCMPVWCPRPMISVARNGLRPGPTCMTHRVPCRCRSTTARAQCRQKQQVGLRRCVFARRPRHHFHLDSATPTIDPAHGVAQHHGKAPQGNELKAAHAQPVIAGTTVMATRAARPRATPGTHLDFDGARVVTQAGPFVDEPRKVMAALSRRVSSMDRSTTSKDQTSIIASDAERLAQYCPDLDKSSQLVR